VDPNDPNAGEFESDIYCRQLISQALEITQNENLRLSLQLLLDQEYCGGSGTMIDLPRMNTEDVSQTPPPPSLLPSLTSLPCADLQVSGEQGGLLVEERQQVAILE
jgi:hypothetical protein